jgi:hypothetical protein
LRFQAVTSTHIYLPPFFFRGLFFLRHFAGDREINQLVKINGLALKLTAQKRILQSFSGNNTVSSRDDARGCFGIAISISYTEPGAINLEEGCQASSGALTVFLLAGCAKGSKVEAKRAIGVDNDRFGPV